MNAELKTKVERSLFDVIDYLISLARSGHVEQARSLLNRFNDGIAAIANAAQPGAYFPALEIEEVDEEETLAAVRRMFK